MKPILEYLDDFDFSSESLYKYGFISFSVAFVSSILFTRYFKRIHSIQDIPSKWFNKNKILRGVVSSVGDGDNFRFVHMPLLRSLVSLKFLGITKEDAKSSFGVRLAGVDAPECAHFGKPDQPYGPEAREWLQKQLTGKIVRIQIYQKDQYDRAVCMVWKKGFFKWKNMSLSLVQHGYGTLYDSKGAVYGKYLNDFIKAEEIAKASKTGMWKQSKKRYMSPKTYKQKYKD